MPPHRYPIPPCRRPSPAALRLVRLVRLALLALLAALLLAGCQEGAQGPLEITGDYVDEYGSDHHITQTTWTSFGGLSVIHILGYSNAQDYLLGQNDAVSSYNPGKYARQDWTYLGGGLYYCSTVFDGATLEDARDGSADRTDPTVGGCSGFAWTLLTP